ncbi:hypothetical protein [Streptomyces sp. BE303]|uniref:hypothetical protein n=1 Tax=Streptomyces sp. BE303 TaxID=3002528 RepID=UPI002E75CAFC|nr:hypothetical protein [Streptomyces sp. BE303]MED7951842.1 hypothetical protein [Streptomyces sp. BE303]
MPPGAVHRHHDHGLRPGPPPSEEHRLTPAQAAPGKIALIVLAVLRHDQRLCDMAGGNDISASTVRR